VTSEDRERRDIIEQFRETIAEWDQLQAPTGPRRGTETEIEDYGQARQNLEQALLDFITECCRAWLLLAD
jgi:hypothetical protein